MTCTVFKNIRVFDGETTHQSTTVVVRHGIVSYLGSSPPSDILVDASTIDGAGRTLLPGLIEAHIHAHLPPGKGPEVLKPAIACGITTCCDMHNKPDDVKMLKSECAKSVELPDLKSAYYGATIEGGWPKPIVLHLDPSEEVS